MTRGDGMSVSRIQNCQKCAPAVSDDQFRSGPSPLLELLLHAGTGAAGPLRIPQADAAGDGIGGGH